MSAPPADTEYKHCTVEECEAEATCVVCHQRKGPRGRSVPLEAANSYCGYDCQGYMQAPRVGHLWPGELGRIREYEAEREAPVPPEPEETK